MEVPWPLAKLVLVHLAERQGADEEKRKAAQRPSDVASLLFIGYSS